MERDCHACVPKRLFAQSSALRDEGRHYGVQARRPSKAGLLAMTALFNP